MTATLRPVVFLDRDGTLNEEIGYIRNVGDLRLIRGAAGAVRRLNQAGVAAVVVTNQSGVARGFYGEDHVLALNSRLSRLLGMEGASLDALYYCPHLEEGVVPEYSFHCSCRKPEVGLVEVALSDDRSLDSRRSYVVGDKATDVELASRVGAKSVLVTTGYGKSVLDGTYQWPVKPDYTATDIGDAVEWILRDLSMD